MSDTQGQFEYQEEPRGTYKPKRHPPSFFWPLVLIGTGALLLLSNLGYLQWESWNALWRLWPILLIALGIDVLIGRRSMIGAIISGLLILALIGGAVALVLFVQDIPALSNLSQPIEWHTDHIEHPLSDIERASIAIDWSSAPGRLSALHDSRNLIEGDITYRGELIFDVVTRGDQSNVELNTQFSGPWFGPIEFSGQPENRWNVMLSPSVPLDLTLDAGSGSYDFNLSDLQISDLFLDVGSGSVALTLPSDSTFNARIDGGSGSLDIVLPEGIGARVDLDSGSGSFRPDERFRLVRGERDGDGVWETDNARQSAEGALDSADHVIELSIDQGSGSIRIH